MQENNPLLFFLEQSGEADRRGEYRRADRALICARLVLSAQHVIDTQGAEDAVVHAVYSVMQSTGAVVMPRLARLAQAYKAAVEIYVAERKQLRQEVAERMRGQEPRDIAQQQALTLARSPVMEELRQKRATAEGAIEKLLETSETLRLALIQASHAAERALMETKLFPQTIQVVFEYMGTTSAFFDTDRQALHINISQLADMDALRQTVRHELIHALENALSGGRPFPSTNQQDMAQYLNQPHEVRSFAADIVHELMPPRPEQINNFPAFFAYLSESPTFQWVLPHLQGETRTLLFRVLYSLLIGIPAEVSYSPLRRVPVPSLLENASVAKRDDIPAVQQPAGVEVAKV